MEQKMHIRQALSQAQMIIIQAMTVIEELEKTAGEQAKELAELKEDKKEDKKEGE